MLSKIKSAASLAAETRSTSFGAQQHQQSDHEDNDDDDSLIDHQTNDTNNNNNNQMDAETGNNNNNNSDLKSASTKTQGELMDIVEISRRRRLSKDSADSLTSFIRWSFVNLEQQQQQQQSKHRSILVDTNDDTILDDASDRNWSSNNNNNNNSIPNKQHSKLINESPNDVSLALLMAQELQQQRLQGRSIVQSDLLNGLQDRQLISGKRTRSQAYSPDNAIFNGPSNKRASYSGSVVERLHNNNNNNNQHNQQQHLLQTAINQSQISDRILKAEQSDSNSKQSDNPGLSYHLQQFLQQQTSLDDNNLALAAALHRAIIDSTSGTGSSAANNAGNNGANQLAAADSKSTASSTGGSSSAVSSSSSNGGGGIDVTGNVNISANNNQIENSGANLNLVDSLIRQRRAYQTRAAAMHSLSSSSAAAAAVASHRQHQQQQQQQSAAAAAAAAAALSLNSRIQQQQRYAQAAAALSALASSGSRSAISSQQQPQAPSAAAAAAAAAAIGLGVNNPMVDFVCETCNSSFDDRHRLMQHQSIHLELKKDWFTETPVDEVMKIFNRRRGEFLCNICNLRFEATLDYDQHNHAVHGPRPYCCQFCGNGTRTFKCWRQYLNHLYDHRYVFSCTIDDCDFTVNRRDSLRFHIFRFHLNCRLPQNQLNSHNHNNNINININKTMNLSKQSHIGAHNLSALGILDGRFRRDPDSRWQLNDRLVVDDHEDDADDTGSEMNVAD